MDIKKYNADRNKALSNLRICEFKPFLAKYESFLAPGFVDRFLNSPKLIQKAMMCKMVCNISAFNGSPTKQKAVAWLVKHNMTGEMCL